MRANPGVCVVLCALLCGPTTALAAERNPSPVAHRVRDGSPVWVSARVAFAPTGELREDLFSPNGRKRLDELRAMNGHECVYAMQFPSLEVHTPTDSLEQLAVHSQAVIAGDVIGAEAGFYRERPGTLFTVRVTNRVKASPISSRDVTYLFVGTGQIETPLGTICAKTPLNSVEVAIGDRVLFFAPSHPIDEEKGIYVVEPAKQILVESARELTLPNALATPGAPRRLDEAIRQAQAAIGTDKGKARVR